MGKTLPYDSSKGVRARLAEVAPHFAVVDSVQGAVWLNGEYIKGLAATTVGTGNSSNTPLASPIDNFFMTDAISRASSTMAKCVLARTTMRT